MIFRGYTKEREVIRNESLQDRNMISQFSEKCFFFGFKTIFLLPFEMKKVFFVL